MGIIKKNFGKIIFIFGFILLSFCSFELFCSCQETKRQDAKFVQTNLNEYLDINNCRYYKIKVGNHDVYQYKFCTYTDTGSDIIHFEDMCNFCKTK